MSHALTKHFEKFISSQIASGRYNNRSEVIRAGLRMLDCSFAISVVMRLTLPWQALSLISTRKILIVTHRSYG